MHQMRHSCVEMSECDWCTYSALRAGTQLLDASAGKSREVAGLYHGSFLMYSEALQRKPKESRKALILNGKCKCSLLGH